LAKWKEIFEKQVSIVLALFEVRLKATTRDSKEYQFLASFMALLRDKSDMVLKQVESCEKNGEHSA